MLNQPLVSIVIPVFNGEDFLEEAIQSAINQTYSNIEILVVNDGSTDRTEKIARKYEKHIRYFYKENGGVASALNLGIKEMKGEYFSWLSHDDYYDPFKIELEIKAIQKQGDSNSVVYCNYSLLDQKTGVFSIYKIEEYYSEQDRTNGILMLMQRMVGGCTLLIHINHFNRVGMFNETLRTTQDYDMWFRILRGISLIHVPRNLVVTRVHEKQGSQTIRGFNEEREQLFLNFLKKMTLSEKIDLWGSEYTCLQHFQSFFEMYSMKKGCSYVKKQLYNSKPPKDIIKRQEQAKIELFQLTNSRLNARIAIFGAGDHGKRVLRMLYSKGIEVDVFLDNDPKKWGSEIEGVQCVSLKDELCNRNETLVIMAVEVFGQIQRQLSEQKFTHVITRMHLEGKMYNVPGRETF